MAPRASRIRDRGRGRCTLEGLEPRRMLSAVFPTAYEQYMLELINRARANPAAEASRFGIDLNEGLAANTISASARQPLAIDPNLTDAARSHSQWMIASQTLSHNEGTIDPPTRMIQAGFVFTAPSGWAENIALRGSTAVPSIPDTLAQEHRDLFMDTAAAGRTHRLNLMNPSLEVVGVGVATGLFKSNNSVVTTQDFAYSAGSGPYLTGVAYNDAILHNNFYEPGEGLAGISITATRASDHATFSTTTWASGGYSLALPAGAYTVAASGTGLGGTVTRSNVTIGSQNVEANFTRDAGPVVVGRYVFYNSSRYDGRNPAANASDDAAIAPDKSALLPGQQARFTNYTTYSRGINGVMVDIANLPGGGAPVAGDFSFAAGNTADPTTWAAAPAATGFLPRSGAGANGSTRIEFTWADRAIKNKWLRVTVAADANTGLLAPDVFYFGNAVGDTGDDASNTYVTPVDEVACREDRHSFMNPAPITNLHDFNRDGRVDAIDEILARNNNTTSANALIMLGAPLNVSVAALSVVAPDSAQWEQIKSSLARARRREAADVHVVL
jgi:uncharacterized protein YkwD